MLGQNDGGKRDKFTLMIEILNNTHTPVKKTHLLYKAGINFHQLDRYLDLLKSKGMITVVEEPFNGYQITEKGIQFLELFNTKGITIKAGSVVDKIAK